MGSDNSKPGKPIPQRYSPLMQRRTTQQWQSNTPQTETRQPQQPQGPQTNQRPQSNAQSSLSNAHAQQTLERPRAPYSFTHEDLNKSVRESLHPDLNESRVREIPKYHRSASVDTRNSQDGERANGANSRSEFEVVNTVNRERGFPQSSAPPSSESGLLGAAAAELRPPPYHSTPHASKYDAPYSAPLPPLLSTASMNNNTQRPSSQNQVESDPFKCQTCPNLLGDAIYQCSEGHSSCQQCRLAMRLCGLCSSAITAMRNIALEALIDEIRNVCPNEGCTLSFNPEEMRKHLKECPFGEMDCPLGVNLGKCFSRCKVDAMLSHFDECHPYERRADVGKELHLFNLHKATWRIFFVKIGPHNFITHVKVAEMNRGVYIAVQLMGTAMSAAKWIYEVHVYNKKQPRRKFLYVSNCLSISVPAEQIFNEANCAVIPYCYVKSFSNDDNGIAYKFYMKKTDMQHNNRPRNKSQNRSQK